jgi:hypothetical protein
VGGETGYCSETCVTGGVGGTGEGSVKDAIDIKKEVSIEVEEAVDIKEEVSIKFEAVYIKDEIQEFTSAAPIQTQQEVRILGCL